MGKRKFVSNEGVNNVYTVETIYKKKMRNNKEPLYYIKWKDWDDKYNSWEPLSNILDHSLIETFEDEIRQKQKLRKDTTKNKLLDFDKLDYESDVKNEIENDIESTIGKKSEGEKIKEDKNKDEPSPDESVSRPKICIKIPKYRIQPPNSSLVTNSLNSDDSSPEKEEARHSENQVEDDRIRLCRLSPIYMPMCSELDKSIKEQSPHHRKSPKKLEANQKLLCKNETQIRKPRRLLSINEYSAVIKMKKKHHKKSKQKKHRSETRMFQTSKDIRIEEEWPEKQASPTFESKKTPQETPLSSLEWPKSRFGGSLLQELASKLESPKFKFHPQTVVTDVTVNGLCVTIKEMSYEDFISDSHRRYQLVRVPRDSSWEERLLNKSCEKREERLLNKSCEKMEERMLNLSCEKREERMLNTSCDKREERMLKKSFERIEKKFINKSLENMEEKFLNKSYEKMDADLPQSDNEDVMIIEEENHNDGEVSKQRLLDRFEERIIPGLRPPSRPRSVDSYKNIMDKTMYCLTRNNFTESTSPRKMTIEVDPSSESVMSRGKSPLNIVVDECEDVDVVGGVESENSYMSSLQSTRTTVTTQIRQARLSNQSQMSSIIDALWQSYSYNSPMTMPPLQAAPWVQAQEADNNHASNHHSLSRATSLEPSLLKYAQTVPFPYYQHPSTMLSNLYLTNGQEAPIDLSFK